jgi:hypothetical protein
MFQFHNDRKCSWPTGDFGVLFWRNSIQFSFQWLWAMKVSMGENTKAALGVSGCEHTDRTLLLPSVPTSTFSYLPAASCSFCLFLILLTFSHSFRGSRRTANRLNLLTYYLRHLFTSYLQIHWTFVASLRSWRDWLNCIQKSAGSNQNFILTNCKFFM